MFMRCTNILNTEIPFFLSTFIVAVFSDGYRYLYYINGVTYIMFSTSLWKFELYWWNSVLECFNDQCWTVL